MPSYLCCHVPLTFFCSSMTISMTSYDYIVYFLDTPIQILMFKCVERDLKIKIELGIACFRGHSASNFITKLDV